MIETALSRVAMALVVLLLAVSACARGTPAPVVYKAPSVATGPSAAGGAAIRPGIHVVVRGESLYRLARRSGVAVRDLIEANGLTPPYHLRVGQRLKIPPVRYHAVKAGETISGLAQRYGVSMHALVRTNGIRPPYLIRTGQRLRLPARVAVSRRDAVRHRPPTTRPLSSCGAS